jgi:hypothetical protein
MADYIKCPLCPACLRPPSFTLSVGQAFCGAPDCPAVCWDMTNTREENIAGVNFVRFRRS